MAIIHGIVASQGRANSLPSNLSLVTEGNLATSVSYYSIHTGWNVSEATTYIYLLESTGSTGFVDRVNGIAVDSSDYSTITGVTYWNTFIGRSRSLTARDGLAWYYCDTTNYYIRKDGWVYTSSSPAVYDLTYNPDYCHVVSNGTKLFTLEGKTLRKHTISTAWDITSISPTIEQTFIFPELINGNPYSITEVRINYDGSFLAIAARIDVGPSFEYRLIEFSMSSAFDISTSLMTFNNLIHQSTSSYPFGFQLLGNYILIGYRFNSSNYRIARYSRST